MGAITQRTSKPSIVWRATAAASAQADAPLAAQSQAPCRSLPQVLVWPAERASSEQAANRMRMYGSCGQSGAPCKPHAHACSRNAAARSPESTAPSVCSLFDGRFKTRYLRCECRSLQRRRRRGGRTPAGSVRPCGRAPVPASGHIWLVCSNKSCSHPAGAPQQPRQQWRQRRRQRPSDGFEHPAAGSRSSDSSDSSSSSSSSVGPEPWLQAQREIQAQQAAGLTQPWPLDSTRVRRGVMWCLLACCSS